MKSSDPEKKKDLSAISKARCQQYLQLTCAREYGLCEDG